MNVKPYSACLALEGGQRFFGHFLGCSASSCGELCFTTSSTGYQHTITDPSFADQIIVFASPHIGNIGINDLDSESKKAFCQGIVLRENVVESDHFLQNKSLDSFLKKNKIPGICGIDTRSLVKIISSSKPQTGKIIPINDALKSSSMGDFSALKSSDLSKKACGFTDDYKPSDKKYRVALVDFGVKSGIAKCLSKYFSVEIIKSRPGFYKEIESGSFDGIVLSNGPGDPEQTFFNLKSDIEQLLSLELPVLGICLGHQILAIKFGCKTFKMQVGHRGANHPVLNLETGKVEITSQNHGFAVKEDSIGAGLRVTHRSLFDGSVEGIAVEGRKIFSVQYHPEGSPGPYDSEYIFAKFADVVKS